MTFPEKLLTCPIDDLILFKENNSLKCVNNHCFDISRQGYVNLLPVHFKKSKHPGDSPEMVAARKNFLNSGVYSPIAENLVTIIKTLLTDNKEKLILDAGCGEGYYLDFIYKSNFLIDSIFLGLDISKEAISYAAKRNKNISWLVASNKRIPIKEKSVDILICQFGFPVFEEFRKVLKDEGKIILIDTDDSHLIEIRKIIYNEVRRSGLPDLDLAVKAGFSHVHTEKITYTATLSSNEQIMNLLSMTPHIFRATKEGKDNIGKMQKIEITIDVAFRVLGKCTSSISV